MRKFVDTCTVLARNQILVEPIKNDEEAHTKSLTPGGELVRKGTWRVGLSTRDGQGRPNLCTQRIERFIGPGVEEDRELCAR
jgi:hypothetical protein